MRRDARAGADSEGAQDQEEINFLIRIKEFRWDEVNERHILWRHDVTRSEAEEAFIGDPYFRIGRDGTRYVYGQTSSGRYLFIVYLYLGRGVARIITARDMTNVKEDYILRGDSTMMAKIPRFRTEQEMQEFWDTHDSAEYFEDMKDDEVQITFGQDKGVLVLPLGEDRVRSVREIALKEGVSSNVLLKNWIDECIRASGKLREERRIA